MFDQCNAKGGYVFTDETGSTCVNKSVCFSSEPKGYIYAAAGKCSILEPDPNGHLNMQDDVYTCGDEYPFLDLTGNTAKCVAEEECVDPNYVYNEGGVKMCLLAAQCAWYKGYCLDTDSNKCITSAECVQTPDHITYDSDDGSERLCVTRDKCPDKGYELRIQCLT